MALTVLAARVGLQGGTASSATVDDCKMVLVVPQDVKMSGGKLAAQSAHAAVGLYKVITHQAPARTWLSSRTT